MVASWFWAAAVDVCSFRWRWDAPTCWISAKYLVWSWSLPFGADIGGQKRKRVPGNSVFSLVYRLSAKFQPVSTRLGTRSRNALAPSDKYWKFAVVLTRTGRRKKSEKTVMGHSRTYRGTEGEGEEENIPPTPSEDEPRGQSQCQNGRQSWQECRSPARRSPWESESKAGVWLGPGGPDHVLHKRQWWWKLDSGGW